MNGPFWDRKNQITFQNASCNYKEFQPTIFEIQTQTRAFSRLADQRHLLGTYLLPFDFLLSISSSQTRAKRKPSIIQSASWTKKQIDPESFNMASKGSKSTLWWTRMWLLCSRLPQKALTEIVKSQNSSLHKSWWNCLKFPCKKISTKSEDRKLKKILYVKNLQYNLKKIFFLIQPKKYCIPVKKKIKLFDQK